LFIEAVESQIRAAASTGAAVVEFHTGAYAHALDDGDVEAAESYLESFMHSAKLADNLGLEVHFGHGLTFDNVGKLASIPECMELNIGNKTFTMNEQGYCNSKARPAMSYAKRFAAKEAVAKALAGEMTGSLSWTSVEVSNDPSGRPTIKLLKDALERAASRCPVGHTLNVHLSLSDDYPYATAFAIAEAIPDVR